MDNTQKMLNISIPVSFSDVPEGGVGESSFTVDEVERIKARLVWEAAQEGIECWTGKYHVDGKKIYGKKVDFGKLPNAVSKSVDYNIINVKDFTDIRGVDISTSNSDNIHPIPLAHTTALNSITMSINRSTGLISITTGVNRSTMTAIITLEYTCTDR